MEDRLPRRGRQETAGFPRGWPAAPRVPRLTDFASGPEVTNGLLVRISREMACRITYLSGFPLTPPIRQCFPSWPDLFCQSNPVSIRSVQNRCFPTPGSAKTEPKLKAQRSDLPRLSSLSVLALSAYAYQEALPLLLAVQNAITLTADADERQRALWQDRVRLDDGFWRSLKEHPVPLREEAVRAIGTRSLALDVYIWLAYRLHALTKATPVTWTALHAQFGAGFKAVRQLKPTFREALALALAVYPEARIDVEPAGVVLHPSPPAVPRAEAKRLGLG